MRPTTLSPNALVGTDKVGRRALAVAMSSYALFVFALALIIFLGLLAGLVVWLGNGSPYIAFGWTIFILGVLGSVVVTSLWLLLGALGFMLSVWGFIRHPRDFKWFILSLPLSVPPFLIGLAYWLNFLKNALNQP